MLMPSQFLSCDWGTSSLRLRLVSTATNEILGETVSPVGVKDLDERGRLSGRSRSGIFAEVATKHIEDLSLRHKLNGQPLIISGMASSNIGWKELPYASVPFALDGSGLNVEELPWKSPEGLGPTYMVSGVAAAMDMIRGEECQAIGLLAQPGLQQFRDRSMLILPGTHSKHLHIEAGSVRTFQTYMTGELFDTLAKHTVLRATIDPSDSVQSHPAEFKAGLKCVKENGLAASLFRVRARGVLDHADPGANAAFLSGLLIGAEVEGLDRFPAMPIVVAANEHLMSLYALALPDRQGVVFTSEIDRATLTAHRLILADICR